VVALPLALGQANEQKARLAVLLLDEAVGKRVVSGAARTMRAWRQLHRM
jgi:hypothetical protein